MRGQKNTEERDKKAIKMSKEVVVVPFRSEWSDKFQDEAQRIKNIFGDSVSVVHHIGSTSVHGLPAKPIIDVMPVALSLTAVDSFRESAEAAGYAWKGENGIVGRRYLTRLAVEDSVPAVHVHIFASGSSEIKKHLAFRDYLRANSDVMKDYAELKFALAAKHHFDKNSYQAGKAEFIDTITAKALELGYGAG